MYSVAASGALSGSISRPTSAHMTDEQHFSRRQLSGSSPGVRRKRQCWPDLANIGRDWSTPLHRVGRSRLSLRWASPGTWPSSPEIGRHAAPESADLARARPSSSENGWDSLGLGRIRSKNWRSLLELGRHRRRIGAFAQHWSRFPPYSRTSPKIGRHPRIDRVAVSSRRTSE